MTPDEIAFGIVSSHTGISFALDKDRERLVERIAAALAAERAARKKAEAERDVAARCLKMWEQASKQADNRADAAREAALREAAALFRKDTPHHREILALIDKPQEARDV